MPDEPTDDTCPNRGLSTSAGDGDPLTKADDRDSPRRGCDAVVIRADDALKYAAALLRSRTEWTCDSIGGSDRCDGHELELDLIYETVAEISRLAAQFGDPRRYADGRVIKSRVEVQRGLYIEHVWRPDPASEESRSWRSALPWDPGIPSPGRYEVTTTPATQDIHVRVVRTA